MKYARKLIALVLITVLVLTFVSCGKKSAEVIDYADSKSFEAALNAGENLEGKIVQFVAVELHPDSAMGFNVWAGEHLNFISSRNPDIKAGDTVVARTTTIESSLGSWFINYEKVDNAVVGDATISSSSTASGDSSDHNVGGTSSTTDTLGPIGTASSEDGSSTGSNNEEVPLELTDYGWYINDSSGDEAFIDFCGMIYNPNSQLVAEFPTITVTAKNGDGSILATEEQMGGTIMPGDTITLCGMFLMPISDVTEDAQIIFEVDCNDFVNGNSFHKSARTTDFEITNVTERNGDENYITGEIMNNFSEDVDMVNLALVLRQNGKIVYMENAFIDNLKVGKATAFEFQRYGDWPTHDSIELSAMVW